MKNDLNYYNNTPVGQQLLVHFKGRTELRRSIPLFPFSFKALFGKKQTGDKNAQRAERRDSAYHAV
ncbi:MAG TPA: hypothetical protein VL002_06705 [Candidimonas sp.]|nr:hypothetical protein [Candidimonas sp.]